MDYKIIINGILPVIAGILGIMYHKKLGDFATKQRSKMMKVEYGEDVRKFNQIAFLIVGIITVLFGVRVIFNL